MHSIGLASSFSDGGGQRPRRGITFTSLNALARREDFDDDLVALTARLRNNADADRILSGEIHHPLIRFQQLNSDSLQAAAERQVGFTGSRKLSTMTPSALIPLLFGSSRTASSEPRLQFRI